MKKGNGNGMGSIIRQIREDNNLTQKQMAKICNCSLASMNQFEANISEPSVAILQTICSTLHVSADYLCQGYSKEIAINALRQKLSQETDEFHEFFEKLSKLTEREPDDRETNSRI